MKVALQLYLFATAFFALAMFEHYRGHEDYFLFWCMASLVFVAASQVVRALDK